MDLRRPTAPPIRFEELDVPMSRLPDGPRAALEEAVTASFVSVAVVRDPRDPRAY